MPKRLSLLEDAVEKILRNPLVRDIYLGKQATALMLMYSDCARATAAFMIVVE